MTTGNYEPVTFCSYGQAMAILEDEMASFWDVAEATACIEWTEVWANEKSYLKFIGEW